MKKLLLSTAAILTLASCAFNPFVSSTPSNQEPPALVLNDDYALKTAAAASLLTDALSGNVNGGLSARKERRLSETEELEAIDKVHQYLGIMNQILTDNPIQTELVESDREGYAFKSIVTTIGLDGTTSVFVLYFNGIVEEEPTSSSSETSSSEETSTEVVSSEESTESSTETTESSSTESSSETLPESSSEALRGRDDDDNDDEDREEIDDEYDDEDQRNGDIDDEDRDEYRDYHTHELGELTEDGDVTALQGLAVVGDLEYQLVGFTKTEGDEIKTKYFLSLDEANWIRIATETETDESEYKIVMKVDNAVSKMAFEIEEEDGETEVKLFIKSENNPPEMYKFVSELHEETGGQLIRIQARVGREKFKATVLIYTDENGEVIYNYRFEGSTRDHTRDGDRDYHDHGDRHDDRD